MALNFYRNWFCKLLVLTKVVFALLFLLGCNYPNKSGTNSINKNDSRLIIDSINGLYRNNDYEAAVSLCNKEIESGNTYPYYRVRRGKLYSKLNEDDLAIKDFNYIISNVSDTIYGILDSVRVNYFYTALYGRAEIFISRKEYKSAYVDLAKLYAFDSLDIHIVSSLATTCKLMGSYSQAEYLEQKAYSLDSSSFIAIVNIGFRSIKKKDFFGALYYFNKAIKIKEAKEQYAAYLGRAIVYGKMTEYDLAEKDYLKAIELSPTNADIYTYYSGLYFMQGKKDKGCELLKKAEELGGDVKHLTFYRICNP